MPMSLLIRNGRVITASDDYVADVYCENGTIIAIGRDLPSHRFQAEREIDASGQYVMPGGIDVHTHLDMPFGGTMSSDDFETGRSVEPPASSTSPSSTAARRCATRWTGGWRRHRARR